MGITLEKTELRLMERWDYIKRIDDGTTRLARTERRQFPRWTVGNLPATLFLGSREAQITIQNLSLSGAGIAGAPDDAAVGDSVVLATCLGNHGPFVARCTIVSRDEVRSAGAIGLRFESLEQEDTNTLFFFLVDQWQQNEAA